MSAPGGERDAVGRRGFDRGAFYRACRMVHAYLSAFAFLALIFFSATGLLLDHPAWLQGRTPPESTRTAQLSPAELAAAKRAPDADRALAAAVGARVRMLGAYKDGSDDEGQAILRLEGAKGSTDLTVDLATGAARAVMQPATAANIVEELHRGRAAGAAWRRVIDVSAVLILALSLVGYMLFFSLRFRLRTSLVLTGVSLAAMAAIYVFAVP